MNSMFSRYSRNDCGGAAAGIGVPRKPPTVKLGGRTPPSLLRASVQRVRIDGGEGPETFERGLEVAPQLARIESLIECLQLVARKRTPAAQSR
jgi:hypothetical protein